MSEPTITLLDASIGQTPAEQNFRRAFDLPVTAWKVSDGDVPPVPDGDMWTGDGVVISGSQTAVYEDRTWIDRTAEWVADAVAAGVPVLGVCWGHQLLARALGGTVEPMGAYELGYATVERVAADPFFDGIDDSFLAFESHSDAVGELPDEATLLAENNRATQAFRVENAFGVQFHPEYDIDTARWVVQNKEGELPTERVERVLDAITPERHADTASANHVFENFEKLVRRRG
ncbi:type 1 glutamine amidotransferase [Halorhabdus sp. CBA1104]|uniref:type 1 glutamine amidotransferase n=1 Tax=Halorhabdus sp. CBA1104 TaxID=1380432 RepID=UPI0012B32E35|nr:type 1 glutamine amidotransferase [Halorhabdus sp. CBA1104]QGN06736.1 type 1 glutamine amidotransferase [Halorhabdus sp. CBA1104]